MSLNIKRIYRLPDHTTFFVWLLLAGSIFIQGCIMRADGCLDIAAENFDLNADRACDNCCTYPTISIILSQKWNEKNFHSDSIWHDVNGDSFMIRDLKYLLSSFSWIGTDLASYTIDSTTISCPGQTVHYTPDIIQVDSRKFNYILDSIRLFPSIQTLKLKLGYVPELECVDEAADNIPVVLRDASPLWDSIMDTRAAIRIVLQRDLSSETLDTVYIHTCQAISIDYADSFELGKDQVLNLTIDYSLWFEAFNLQDLNSVYDSVLNGIQGSFSRTP